MKRLITIFASYIFTALLLCRISFAAEPIRLGVMDFVSRADEVTNENITLVSSIANRVLFASKGISVLEREKLDVIASQNNMTLSAGSDSDTAIKVGRLAGCQYMLLGVVTQLSERTSFFGQRNWNFLTGVTSSSSDGAEYTYTASIEARIIDVTTGRVFASFPVTGEGMTLRKGEQFKMDGSMQNVDLRGTAKRMALASAASKLGDKVRETLVQEYPSVLAVNTKDIQINRGRMSDVSEGTVYCVYSEGENITDVDGSVLGKKKTIQAIVMVTNVRDEFSNAEVLENGGKLNNLRRGDKLELITMKDAEDFIVQDQFPAMRMD